jgi:hypothetical protein
MNLFDLGGQYLRVGRAITPPDTKNLGEKEYLLTSIYVVLCYNRTP